MSAEYLRRIAALGGLTSEERENIASLAQGQERSDNEPWRSLAAENRALLALDAAAKALRERTTAALRRALGRPHEKFNTLDGSEYGCRFCSASRQKDPRAIAHTPECPVSLLTELESEVRHG